LRATHLISDNATYLTNAGLVLKALGRFSEAMLLLGKALEINQRVLGEVHPDTKTALANWQAIRLKNKGEDD